MSPVAGVAEPVVAAAALSGALRRGNTCTACGTAPNTFDDFIGAAFCVVLMA
jgi:hypothetical protein